MKYIVKSYLLTGSLLTLVILMQIPSVIFGFELCDSGYYMTFYANIFNHPEDVSYNFMYYLTGLVGGSFWKLSGGSILLMRVFGAVCNVLSVWFVWRMLGNLRLFLPLVCAVVLILAGSWAYPLTFYNDHLSALLAILSLSIMLKALMGDCPNGFMWFCLSGIAAGINLFSRLPNILELLFVFIIPLCMNKRSGGVRGVIKSMLCWFSGWLAGVLIVVLIAIYLGHGRYIVESIGDVLEIGAEGSGASHSINELITVNLRIWIPIIYIALKFAAVFLVYGYTRLRLVGMGLKGDSVQIWSLMWVPVFYWLLFCERWLLNFPAAEGMFSIAIALPVLSIFIDGAEGHRLRIISLMGLFMLLILPLGSDRAIFNAGPVLLWIALPVGWCVMCRSLDYGAGKALTLIFSITMLLPLIQNFFDNGVYFDNARIDRFEANVDMPCAGGIRTTTENAAHICEMYDSVSKYVKPDDTMLVYGSAPMLNYITRTRPALGCSWPELFSANQLRLRLEKSDRPKWIILMKVPTLGGLDFRNHNPGFESGFNLATEKSNTPSSSFHSVDKSSQILDYISHNGYEIITETSDLKLYKYYPE